MINWIRNGFIKCSILEGPFESHHVDARDVKCDISFGSAEVVAGWVECGGVEETLRGGNWWGIFDDERKRQLG